MTYEEKYKELLRVILDLRIKQNAHVALCKVTIMPNVLNNSIADVKQSEKDLEEMIINHQADQQSKLF